MDTQSTNPNMILPVGTKIVIKNPITTLHLPAGAVGIIIESPIYYTYAYRIRFPNGNEKSLKRNQFFIQKHLRREGLERDPKFDSELYSYVIYRCVVGSRAYGLEHENSDVDIRGIYLPPATLHWSLFGIPEQLSVKKKPIGNCKSLSNWH